MIKLFNINNYQIDTSKLGNILHGEIIEEFEKAGFRMVPNSPVRKGSFVGKNAVLMPCYVNIGAYIDEGTMIDTFARAGSCSQIGKNCHISAGSGVGGVLEPAQALQTIIYQHILDQLHNFLNF